MTYEELYHRVCEALPPDVSFCLEVETWRREPHAPDTRWSIYVAREYMVRVFGTERAGEHSLYEGPTAAHAWAAFEAACTEQPLSETSAAIGAGLRA